MSDVTDLAFAQINGADQVTIQLIRPAHMPAIERTPKPSVVRIVWPAAPTLVHPSRFPDVASEVALLFARAHVVLAALKAQHRGEL